MKSWAKFTLRAPFGIAICPSNESPPVRGMM